MPDARLVGREHRDLQCLHLPKHRVDLGIAHVVVDRLDVREEVETGRIELRSHVAEAIEGLRDAPLTQLLARAQVVGRAFGRRLAEAATVHHLRLPRRNTETSSTSAIPSAVHCSMMTSIGSRPVFSGSGLSEPVISPILTPRTSSAMAGARRPASATAPGPTG
jgi:hypothetical protein